MEDKRNKRISKITPLGKAPTDPSKQQENSLFGLLRTLAIFAMLELTIAAIMFFAEKAMAASYLGFTLGPTLLIGVGIIGVFALAYFVYQIYRTPPTSGTSFSAIAASSSELTREELSAEQLKEKYMQSQQSALASLTAKHGAEKARQMMHERGLLKDSSEILSEWRENRGSREINSGLLSSCKEVYFAGSSSPQPPRELAGSSPSSRPAASVTPGPSGKD